MKKEDFEKYLMRNEDSTPIKMYRGFHAEEGEIEKHLENPFITFNRAVPTFTGSPHTASVYAVSPNNYEHDTGDSYGVVGIYEIAMKKPLIINESRYIDYVDIREIFGSKLETIQWKSFLDEAMNKGAWYHDGCETYLSEFNEMEQDEQDMAYIETYWLCDDARVITLLKSLGYDGIASIGVSHLDEKVEDSPHYDNRICACSEYRPFNKDQVRYESNKEMVYQNKGRVFSKEREVEMEV